MIQVIRDIAKYRIKKKAIKIALFLVKPFIMPIILILILIMLISCVTDILYIAFNNDDKIDMKQELAYYNTTYDEKNDKQEVKGFFSSVFDFVNKVFAGDGMSKETDWPVERTL